MEQHWLWPIVSGVKGGFAQRTLNLGTRKVDSICGFYSQIKLYRLVQSSLLRSEFDKSVILNAANINLDMKHFILIYCSQKYTKKL